MVKSPVSRTVLDGDSGRRKERIKIPLIGWEDEAREKDARSRGRFPAKFPKLSRVKLKAALFHRSGKATI
jgi:hypothetical protein